MCIEEFLMKFKGTLKKRQPIMQGPLGRSMLYSPFIGLREKWSLPHLNFGKSCFSWTTVKFHPAFGRNCLPGPCWSAGTCYIFHGATTVLSNSGRAAYFCYQTLEDAWHVINLQNWLYTWVLSTDGDSDSPSLLSLSSSLISMISSGTECSLVSKGNLCVCETDIVECGTRTGARFLIFIIEDYRNQMAE